MTKFRWSSSGAATSQGPRPDRRQSEMRDRGGHLMISPVPGAPGRARVIGSLTGETIQLLLDAVKGGVAVFDLSEVGQVDHHAVRVMAMLATQRCTLLNCPRWLELWLARIRRNGGD